MTDRGLAMTDRRPAMTDRKHRRIANARRLVVGALMLLFLAGPTPGAVGSCGAEEGFADLLSYCREKEELICWRRELRGEFGGDPQGVVDCRRQARRECEERFWPPDCRPTERQANACINALSSADTVETAESEIAECEREALCTVDPEDTAANESAAGGGVGE